MNTRARRVGGAARGPWRAPPPAVAGVHAVCTHAARIWGGLGPFDTYGHTWPRAPGRPGRREPRLPIAYLLFLSSPVFLRVITSKTGQHGRVVNAKKSVTETIEELVIRYQRAAVTHRDSLAVTLSLARSPCFKSHVVVRP